MLSRCRDVSVILQRFLFFYHFVMTTRLQEWRNDSTALLLNPLTYFLFKSLKTVVVLVVGLSLTVLPLQLALFSPTFYWLCLLFCTITPEKIHLMWKPTFLFSNSSAIWTIYKQKKCCFFSHERGKKIKNTYLHTENLLFSVESNVSLQEMS